MSLTCVSARGGELGAGGAGRHGDGAEGFPQVPAPSLRHPATVDQCSSTGTIQYKG